MSYTPGIPNANDLISQSQSQIRTNFVQLNSQFSVDHVPFDAGTNNGKHEKVTLLEQVSDPTTAADEMAIYVKDDGGSPQIFVRQESNGDITPIVGPFPTGMKAYARFSGTGSFPVTPSQSFGVQSISRPSIGRYDVTLQMNAVSSASFGVIATGQMESSFTTGGIVGVSNLGFAGGVGTFRINAKSLTASAGANLNPITFVVFQI